MDQRQSDKGFATLTSVIVASAIASAIGVTLLLSGISSTRGSIATSLGAQANALANACAEEALQAIHDNLSYTGQFNRTLGDGTCSATVTDGGGQLRTITSTGTVGGIIRKVKITTSALTPKITVSSWQEVGDF
ncbi:hypothetical protein HZA86_04090 [Candidatus Uhrbacteria bacterium]|nr:hypothetical protein [Candidatus Uhrbacteria bacterium]